MFELPQAWRIYTTHSAADVSLSTWSFFVAANIVWIIYAVRNKLRLLVGIYSLYMAIECSIVAGILLYS